MNKSPGNKEARIGMEKANAMTSIPHRLKSKAENVSVNSEPSHSKLLTAKPPVSEKGEPSISTSKQNLTTQNQVKIAIFPWKMLGDAYKFKNIVLSSFSSEVKHNPQYQIQYSCYPLGTSSYIKDLYEAGLTDGQSEAIWKKNGFFSEEEIDEESIFRLGEKLGVDAIFAVKFHVVDKSVTIAVKKFSMYLIDIKNGRTVFINSRKQSNIYNGQFNAELASLMPELLRKYNEAVTN